MATQHEGDLAPPKETEVEPWVLVTGANSGLGRAYVHHLAERGIKGIGIDRSGTSVAPPGWVSEQIDISSEDEVSSAFHAFSEKRSAPTGVVNCAGVLGVRSNLVDLSLDDWRAVQRVNVDGTFLVCREAARWMIRDAVCGRIVNIASQLGRVVSPQEGHYAVTKAAVLHLTRALAVELAPNGIQVNSVSPGVMVTPMLGDLEADAKWTARMKSRIPLGRLANPMEIIPVIDLCLDTKSTYLTGADLVVDGGWILQ